MKRAPVANAWLNAVSEILRDAKANPKPKRVKKPDLQLSLPLGGKPGGLWSEVDSMDERALKAIRERRKLVKPKLKQADLLAPPPKEDD